LGGDNGSRGSLAVCFDRVVGSFYWEEIMKNKMFWKGDAKKGYLLPSIVKIDEDMQGTWMRSDLAHGIEQFEARGDGCEVLGIGVEADEESGNPSWNLFLIVKPNKEEE
tara:strand:+ start:2261 stop:2587 length:327 start_codon:yes stop_codon:yes gene_type:complete